MIRRPTAGFFTPGATSAPISDHGAAMKKRSILVGSGLLLVAAACVDRGDRSVALTVPETPVGLTQEDTGYVVTPAGRYHRSCVHELPMGAQVTKDGEVRTPNGVINRLARCAFPIYRVPRGLQRQIETPTVNGYVERAYAWAPDSGYEYATGYTGMSASWRVPQAPATAYSAPHKVYYAFPGLEPADFSNILQPVIQYGNNGAFGGAYWVMSVWTCGSTGWGCAHGNVVRIAAGDSIDASITRGAYYSGGAGAFDWILSMRDVTANTSSGFTWGMSAATLYNYGIGGAVEVYNLTTCNEFPAVGPTFQSVKMHDGALNWWGPVPVTWYQSVQSNPTPNCGFGVTTGPETVAIAR